MSCVRLNILCTCTCRAYANCGHVMYRAQDVVQCTSIVASAAVSSDGSYSHKPHSQTVFTHTQLFMSGLRSAAQRESGDHTTPSILVQHSLLCKLCT